MMSLLEQRLLMCAGFIMFTYFIWMDVALYFHIQARRPGGKKAGTTAAATRHYTPFSDINIKLAMSDHTNHYVYAPMAEAFEDYSHFSEVFPSITPNMISISHAIVALIASKFIASKSLSWRRFGAILFAFRTFLDALDGVVYRARTRQVHKFSSARGSTGYYYDAGADFFAGLVLSLAFVSHCKYYLSNKKAAESAGLPWKSVENGSGQNGHNTVVSRPSLRRTVLVPVVSLGVLTTVSAGAWDRYIHEYHTLLESGKATVQQQVLQNEVMQSSSMWMIIWFWRICNAHGLFEIALIMIFIDKVWDYVVWMQYVGPLFLVGLVILTEIHLYHARLYIGPLPT